MFLPFLAAASVAAAFAQVGALSTKIAPVGISNGIGVDRAVIDPERKAVGAVVVGLAGLANSAVSQDITVWVACHQTAAASYVFVAGNVHA